MFIFIGFVESGAGYLIVHRLSQYIFFGFFWASESTDCTNSTDKKTANCHLFVFALSCSVSAINIGTNQRGRRPREKFRRFSKRS